MIFQPKSVSKTDNMEIDENEMGMNLYESYIHVQYNFKQTKHSTLKKHP